MSFKKTGIGTSLGVVPVDTNPKTAQPQPKPEHTPSSEPREASPTVRK